MVERGLLPDFSPEALAELDEDPGARGSDEREPVRDLRDLLWASIDNDDSRDLDQLTVAEALPDGERQDPGRRGRRGCARQDGSAIDEHARHNTTSVYTAGRDLPDAAREALHRPDLAELSARTGWRWSSRWWSARTASLRDSDVYRARVRNHAKLAYDSVAAWLEGNGPMPDGDRRRAGLDENLRLQDRAAQRMKKLRHVHGALSLETIEAQAGIRRRPDPRIWKSRRRTAPRTSSRTS